MSDVDDEMETSWRPFLWFFSKDLIAGTSGGMAGIIAGQPMDTIKVRQQTAASNVLPSSVKIARDMLRKEGPLSFFRGMVAPLIANAPINALIFTVYGGIVRKIEEDDGERGIIYDDGDVVSFKFSNCCLFMLLCCHTIALLFPLPNECCVVSPFLILAHLTLFPLSSFLFLLFHQLPEPRRATPYEQLFAGAAGGFAQSFVACPSELIKIQQQVVPTTTVSSTPSTTVAAAAAADALPPSTYDLAQTRIKLLGWRVGLFQGFTATILRDVPALGLYFWSYGWFKQRFERMVQDPGVRSDVKVRDSGSWIVDTLPAFMGGGMAGVTSWAFTMPCDVVKSHIQSLSLDSSSSSEVERRWLAVAKWGIEKHGVKYFFRGFGPAVLRAFPVSAVVFTVYEFIMTNLDNYDESIGGVY